ncbi:MAG: response regulator [Planctomycetes bacterium]|nr:response regulator [Planctomycetota bacterium]
MSEKRKILIAEDDEFVLSLLEQIEDYDLTMVKNGEDCLAALGKGAYDAVILDVLMPKTSGLAVLRKLKCEYPNTAVVVVTGYGDILRTQIVEIGVDAFIEKPFTIPDIVRAVETALKLRGDPPPS